MEGSALPWWGGGVVGSRWGGRLCGAGVGCVLRGSVRTPPDPWPSGPNSCHNGPKSRSRAVGLPRHGRQELNRLDNSGDGLAKELKKS